MSPVARTIRLDQDIDPFEIGSRSGLLWSRGDFALAGIGETMRIPIERPSGGGAAAEVLASLRGSDDVERPGTGPVGFAAFPFDRQSGGALIVPEIVVGRGGEGRRWVTLMGAGPVDIDDVLERIRAVADRPVPAGPQPTEYELRSVLPPEVWRDEIVAIARDRIKNGELSKAVLARELVLTTDQPIDPALVLDRLAQSYRSSIIFAIDGFVGASPELLVSRFDDVVRAHPLAGTAPRSSDPDIDQRLSAALLASDKDRREHRITIDWLLDVLLPFCSYVDAEPEPTIVSLANVHHLGTRVEGRLSSPPASVLELIEALHPTPAVGGDPQSTALELIGDLERTERGRYAGPAGWVDANGNGSFAVSVRSAQMPPGGALGTSGPSETRLFAGVGVVADSDPEAELAETRTKFQAMLGALIRP